MSEITISACRDDPSDLDITSDELFGSDSKKTIPLIVDNRPKATVYSQWIEKDTKMACGSYGMRHIANLAERING